MQRYGQTIGLKPEAIARYEVLHAAVWPEVLATIRRCNIRNYSIFRSGATLLLTSNMSEPLSRATWRRCRPTPKRKNGGG